MNPKTLLLKMVPCYFLAFILCIMAAKAGSKTVSTQAEQFHDIDRTCIAIDAGHGGIDGGAVSITGIPESQINLEIAERLNDLLHLLGFQTHMLRTEDTSLHTEGSTISAQKVSDLKQRTKMIADSNASLLISIHQNTFSDQRYSGAQVFYSSHEESAILADQLQKNFIKTINPDSNRKPKPAKGIYLMEHITCPGVLIECGFLTNAKEEALLRNSVYQQKICCVIGATVSSAIH